jgi:hypothetical protein
MNRSIEVPLYQLEEEVRLDPARTALVAGRVTTAAAGVRVRAAGRPSQD